MNYTEKKGQNMSKFFCDTNGELWYTRVDELGLNVIFMPYSLDGEEYNFDLGRTMDFKGFYERLKNGADAKTQGLNVQNYIDYFEPVLQGGEDIIYVHFSSEMSGTFKQMNQAIEFLKGKYPERKITTVDTKSICVGAGMVMWQAAKLWAKGASDEEIVRYVEENRNNFALYFVVKDLAQLKRGGRLSSASYIVGTMLNIKPVIRVDETGSLNKFTVAKGFKAGIKLLLSKVKELGSDLKNYPLVIAHADVPELADEFEKMIIEEFGDGLEIWKQPIGPTVACHCGVGTIGVGFHSKKR